MVSESILNQEKNAEIERILREYKHKLESLEFKTVEGIPKTINVNSVNLQRDFFPIKRNLEVLIKKGREEGLSSEEKHDYNALKELEELWHRYDMAKI